MARTIFFSWQSDLETRTHRNFLEKCINKTLKELDKNNETHVYMNYDRDTKNIVGTPDICSAIFEKIEKCVLFICDVSIINKGDDCKKTANPNVLIELGFAAKCLGWDKIICIFDESTGKIENLPFDIRQKRLLIYNSSNSDLKIEEKRIVSILKENIMSLFVEGKLFNPLNDYMKGRIDKNLLDVCKPISNIIFGTMTMSEGLANTTKFLSLSKEKLKDKLINSEFPAFLLLNTYELVLDELREILKELLSSTYFPKEWCYIVLNYIDWLRRYEQMTSIRNPYPIFEYITEKNIKGYKAISATSINPNNPENSKIILKNIIDNKTKKINNNAGEVINTTQYSLDESMIIRKCKFNKTKIELATKMFFEFQTLCVQWLDITDSEFILNPDYYVIN